MTRNIILIIIAVIYILSSYNTVYGISFTASVDKPKLSLNDRLILSLTISGANISGISTPQLPKLDNFDILGSSRSQSISIINGRVSTSLTIRYTLMPRTTGKFTIPPATLKYQGKLLKTNPIQVEVVKPAQSLSPRQQRQPVYRRYRDRGVYGNLFIKTTLDNYTPYVNQQIVLTFSFYRRINLWENPQYEKPSTTGFWVEELPSSSAPQRRIINGLEYLVHEMHTALFPTAPGEYTIGEAVLTCSVSPFQPPVRLKTKPIKVKVLPLPQKGKPVDFSGCVGRFNISAWVDKKEVTVGEPVTLTIKISGQGNIKTIPKPKLPPLVDLKKYDSGETANTSTSGTKIIGGKIYKYVLVPTTAGEHIINPIRFSYFDPYRKRYVVKNTAAIKIKAKSSGTIGIKGKVLKQDIKILKKDIRYIKDTDDIRDESGYLYQNKWYLAMHIIPVFLLIGAVFYKKHLTRLQQDIGYLRLTRSTKVARRRLARAKKLLSLNTEKEFYGEVSKALYNYLADKLNIPAASITIDNAKQLLEKRNISDKLITEFCDCLSTCDYARFAPITSTIEHMQQVLDKAKDIITSMEKYKL